ncbi:MAG: peptidoglycan DD-metalloendopeptidase family protein [Desulfobulbaceae bacterium]|jgi:murein hydrolase activator|nr:peptidoglycan DD-metalloendopeptidase family protein [Desulfobulbaceae bacterium]
MRFSAFCITKGISRISLVWQKHLSGLGNLAVFFIFTLQTLTTPSLFAGQADADAPENKEVSSFRIKIRRLQQGILHKEDQISETESKEQNILAELEVLDKKIVQQQAKLSELETKMRKQQTLIDREETALGKIRGEKGIVEDHLKKRIAAYYTMGDIGLLNVTFSTQTLPELLTFHDAFDVLIKYDQDVIKVYRDTIKEMERAKAALDLEKAILQEFINQTIAEKEVLENAKAEKHLLLTQVRTQTKLHKQAVDEMQQASEDLTKSIVAIKSKNQVDDQGFLADKGNLRPPVDGVLVTLFQQEKVNKLGISRKSLGIELQAPDGTSIVAVGDGEVIFSGYLRGYGNTVIIHHGFQYYTVTSRIEKILVTKGQKIKREDTIGIMGGTATLFDDGIYFEIRHGSQSLDPLIWLNPNRLKTSHEHSGEPPNQGSSVQ